MMQNNVAPAPGSRHNRKRVGRGDGSGHGSYSCAGCKGQKNRTGSGARPGFEGGQTPIVKRLPEKRGFVNVFRVAYAVVNLKDLNVFPAQSEVTPQILAKAGLIDGTARPVKVLGEGDIDRPLTVKAQKFSAMAEKRIVDAGGRVERL
ncbi:MAG: 50S ribosomal protein L15 [Dehalococcoidia bacterium]|nr:50S ribosomal protein L15 [Dehalococcoidia bacterium]